MPIRYATKTPFSGMRNTGAITRLSAFVMGIGLLYSSAFGSSPSAWAATSSGQTSMLANAPVPVLVPGANQPFADETPTSVTVDAGGYAIDYGTAPTLRLTGSTNDDRHVESPYVCGSDDTPYCADVVLTAADGEQAGDEIFRGLRVGGHAAAVEHFSCCNGSGWTIEWSAPEIGAWYALTWKGDVIFAPSDLPNFDPSNAQYAQALADIAAQLVLLPDSPPAQSGSTLPVPGMQAQGLCGAPPNPWEYNFCGTGAPVGTPPSSFCSYFTCIPSFWKQTNGYVVQCVDGYFSHSGGVRGACSDHRGVSEALDMP